MKRLWALTLLLSVWVGASACGRDHTARPFEARATTTTSSTSTTTTTSPPPTTLATRIGTAKHSSRSLERPRPAPVAAGECNAWGWSRTRADLDRCWGGELAKYPWPAARMAAIMWCESRGDPWAKNPHSSAAGLFQILGASQGDGPGNIALAFSMWQERGTSPWRACGG